MFDESPYKEKTEKNQLLKYDIRIVCFCNVVVAALARKTKSEVDDDDTFFRPLTNEIEVKEEGKNIA